FFFRAEDVIRDFHVTGVQTCALPICVRNVFMPPTALKMLRQSNAPPADLKLRTIASGGETLGEELLGWARETFGIHLNEFYGQRSEEHTSELQSREKLVCRLLLDKKK